MLNKFLVTSALLFLISGCAAGAKKSFTVTVDPADANIKVVSGREAPQEFQSPAQITVLLPDDRVLEARAVVEITREDYRPKKVPIRTITGGEALDVKLEKLLRYQLSLRLLAPVRADEFAFSDKYISLAVTATDKGFSMNIGNVGVFPITILWNQAEMRDLSGRQHRLMHTGIRFSDRNNPIPDQRLAPGASLQYTALPVSAVSVSPEWQTYEVQPVFPVEGENVEALKGKIFYIFLPIEVNRQIVPYNFRVEIVDAVKTS